MYRKSLQGWEKHLDFIFLDVICLNISFLIAYVLRHGLLNPYANYLYRNMILVSTLIEIIVVIFFDSMKNVLKRGFYVEFMATLKQVCLVELLTSFYLFITQEGEKISRITLLLMGVIYLLTGYTVRLLWKKFLKQRMQVNGKRSLLLITVSSRVSDIISNIQVHNYGVFHIAGIAVMDKNLTGNLIDNVLVVADKESVVEYICREWVDEVFLEIPQEEPLFDELIKLLAEMGVVIHTKFVKFSELEGQIQLVERIGNYTVLTSSINYASIGQLLAKRMLDIIGGLVGCIITAILFVFVAPMIYIQSPGPIFFSQERVGKNGKRFKIYKFRSMYLDAEERKKELSTQNRVKDGMMFKVEFDDRIIGCKLQKDGTIKRGFGNFIRDFSIDEFPQFFNVLRGNMSLVGTRPPTIDEWEKYDLHHRARLAIKPGLTGMWQVNGRSNIIDFENVVRLDKEYIKKWSMGLDIKILLKTLLVVLKKEGSM